MLLLLEITAADVINSLNAFLVWTGVNTWHLVKRMFFIQLQKQSSNGSRVCIAIELFSVFKLKNWYEMFVLLYVRWFVHTTPCHNWIDRQQNNSIRYFFHFVSLILIHSSGKNRISCRFQFLVALHNSHFFRLVDNFLLCFLSFCLLLICKFWGTLTFFLCNVWYVQGIGSSVKIYLYGDWIVLTFPNMIHGFL